jgi:hypothetical protein
MRRATRNYILGVILFILALFQAISGFILWFGLARGGGQGRGWGGGTATTFWALTRNTWTDIHSWVAVALLVIVIVHLILHWKWIVYVTKSFFREKPVGL